MNNTLNLELIDAMLNSNAILREKYFDLECEYLENGGHIEMSDESIQSIFFTACAQVLGS